MTVPLKILLADDSMTAQNMGKKILVEGGYEVVTVSNGAAAVKKIAEHKPDLAILDVYMPGYTGLEVCERVKNAAATARMPVLLTVGKMEPFNPAEGNRVKADGVLIKPFEASDLLAALGKLAEKLEAPGPTEVATTEGAGAEASEATYQEQKAGSSEPPQEHGARAKIEIPQEMAVTPVFGDILGVEDETAVAAPAMELHHPEAVSTPAPPSEGFSRSAVAAAAAAGAQTNAPTLPDSMYGLDSLELDAPALPAEAEPAGEPVFDLNGFDAPVPMETPAPPAPMASTVEAETAVEAVAPESAVAPAAAEAVIVSAPPAELEPTAAPAASIDVEPLPDLEPSVLQDSIPVEVIPDAGLVTTPEEMAAFTTAFGTTVPDTPETHAVNAEPLVDAVTDVAPEPIWQTPEPPAAEILEPPATDALAVQASCAADGFAALDALIPTAAAPNFVLEPIEESEEVAVAPVNEMTSSIADQQRVQEVLETIAEPAAITAAVKESEETLVLEPEPNLPEVEIAPDVPVFEPEPTPEVAPFSAVELEPLLASEPETVVAEAEPVSAVEAEPIAEIAPALATAAAPEPIVSELAAKHGVDEDVIADIVDRVVQRLKPELVTEIAKKLKR